MEELKKLIAEQNALIAEQNNILRAAILAFTKEFTIYRHYATAESRCSPDNFKEVHDGCEGHASTTLFESLHAARPYAADIMNYEPLPLKNEI